MAAMSAQLAIFDPLEMPLHGPKRRRYTHLSDFERVLELEAKRLRRLPGIKPTTDYNDGWRFRDAFREAYPDWAMLDVLVGRSPAQPLNRRGKYTRPIRDVARKVKANAAAGETFWKRLGSEWLQMYDVINSDHHTEAKVWLWQQRKPVQWCEARYSFGFWIALSYLRGEDLRGGMYVQEFRRRP